MDHYQTIEQEKHAMKITPTANGFAADITECPPGLDVSDSELEKIKKAWTDHSLLCFRAVTMTPQEHIRFSRRLGELHIMKPLKFNLDGHPEIFVVSNASKNDPNVPVASNAEGEAGLRRAGEGFHTDGEDKVIPNAGSLLYARQLPPERGDTLFVDMYRAYEKLPEHIKHAISGRRARYSRIDLHPIHYPYMAPLTDQEKRDRPDVYHPLARKHPISGRTSLYIGRWACDIEGLPQSEGKELISYLQRFAQNPEFIYTKKWVAGDAVLWDNRCTQHCATGFDDQKYVRTMHRTTLEGEPPIMACTTAGIDGLAKQ